MKHSALRLMAITSFGVAVVLTVLGTAVIIGAQYWEFQLIPLGDPATDGGFSYLTWDTTQLATGIVLALVGTAMAAASLTFLILTRKEKRP